MRYWLITAFLLASCNSSSIPNTIPTQPIRTPAVTIETLTPIPVIPTSIADIPGIPNIVYRAHPASQSIERITNDTIQIVAQGIDAQIVVANHDHSRLAIRTRDDSTVLFDVATTQQYGPFDACDSMTWAPDNATLWCMRFGHIYTIDTPSQTDQINVTATGDIYWAELTRHPITHAYWMLINQHNQLKLCQLDTLNQVIVNTCLDSGHMPRWSPDGLLFASIIDQQLIIRDTNAHLITQVGLGNMVVTQLTWIDTTQLVMNTQTQSYGFNKNDARISLQASEAIIVGR